jgi:hypothetical protein
VVLLRPSGIWNSGRILVSRLVSSQHSLINLCAPSEIYLISIIPRLTCSMYSMKINAAVATFEDMSAS